MMILEGFHVDKHTMETTWGGGDQCFQILAVTFF